MTYFDDKLSQSSKNVLRRLENFTPTCYPDISNVTQCPNPEIAIYLE